MKVLPVRLSEGTIEELIVLGPKTTVARNIIEIALNNWGDFQEIAAKEAAEA